MNRTGFGNEQKQKAKPARSKTNEKKNMIGLVFWYVNGLTVHLLYNFVTMTLMNI